MNPKTQRKIITGLFIIVLIGAFGFALTQVMASLTVPANDFENPPVPDEQDQTVYAKAKVWQALWITPVKGESYWANAPQPFSLASILGSKDGKDFTEVATMQNNIYMTLTEPVNSWTFSCQETIAVRDENGDLAAVIVDAKTVNAAGQAAPANQNLWVAGATVTGEQLQGLLNLPSGSYTLTISLQNIGLTIDDMQLSAVSGTEQNVLSWPIQIP